MAAAKSATFPAAATALIEVPGLPWPKGTEVRVVDRPGGVRLRTARFPTPGRKKPRGTVVLSPGRTEPIEKYAEVIGELLERGFVVLAHDWRGQGGSSRLTPDVLAGHTTGWRAYLTDYAAVLNAWAGDLPKPWIAMGHSMGGGLTALALSEGQGGFSAAVLSAPMLGVATGDFKPSAVIWGSFFRGLMGQGEQLPLPHFDPLDETFESQTLTHDHARWSRTQALITAHPDLRLGGFTWGWIGFALVLNRKMTRKGAAERITIPLTIVAAEIDHLCVNADSKAVAERAPKGRYLEVEGAWHEVLMETDPRRAAFWQAFDETVAGL